MSDPGNDEQRAQWNGRVGERWVAAQAHLDRSLGRIHDAVMAHAAARADDRVLDVGCGCGTTSLALRAQARAVTGVDISAPMLELARARAVGTDLTFLEADASTARFAAPFDLVFSRFGVMFFADPVAAFTNLRAAMAPGGRLAFVCWRSPAENGWAGVPLAAALEVLPPQPRPEPGAPGPFAFADRARVADILGRAGFRDVVITAADSVMFMGEDLEDAATHALTIGPLARACVDADDATLAEIRRRVLASLAPFATASEVALPAAVWMVSAKA